MVQFSDHGLIVSSGERAKRSLMLRAFRAAIQAAQPNALIKNRMKLINGRILVISESKVRLDLKRFDKLIVVGAGKAAGGMAVALESMLGSTIAFGGAVTVLQGTGNNYHTRRVTINEATHPMPSIVGVRATKEIVKLLESATADSLVICLFSGGGSSLMCLPADGVSVAEKTKVTNLLLKSGASIEKINCVRKHLSKIKGGLLPTYTHGATILSLIISDIVGNPLDSIASGPTVADSSSFGEAIAALKEYEINRLVSPNIMSHLRRGSMGLIPETPKPGNHLLDRVQNVVIGDNTVACEAAVEELYKKIPSVYYLGSEWEGTARDVGSNMASMLCSLRNGRLHSSLATPSAFVWGGETTVKVTGKGRGGRNQEGALSAIERIGGKRGVCIGFLGTDGRDGNSDAAGAIVDYSTFQKAQAKKIEPLLYLRNNDSYHFFKRIGSSLLRTGDTGTNVADVGIAIVS
ncbi:MAG: DUF4147 domain-containing protein [Nitrososphaerota archaeon]|nr:DUF4147 domain-containing protein [Nitrososphaerota archaeon]